MSANPSEATFDEYATLEQRVGALHLRQRLGLEADHEAFVFGSEGKFFHLENWYSVHSVIRNSLRAVGLYGRARRNARAIRLTHNVLRLPDLPTAFDGYRILHISDLHVDMDRAITHSLKERLRDVDYDLCVLTGDYRARTFGRYDAVLEGMAAVRQHLREDAIYAVLGNHDTIRMVPGFEAMGIRVLINESIALERNRERIHLAGIDDAHYYRVHDIARAASAISLHAVSILLSHTPEVYRHAAHAGFSAMLCGHTHGGQICLPGGIPLTWDADCPRALAAGSWRYQNMIGFTSVGAGTSIVNARLNCPPEITLHRLQQA